MDTQTSLSTNEQETKAKPGPKAKPKTPPFDYQEFLVLEARIHNLEQLIVRMAHQSGTSHQILLKAGLTPFTPSRNDMTKFKKVG